MAELIRKGETDNFIVDGEIAWFFILTIKNGKIVEQYFTGSKKGKREMMEKANELLKKDTYFKLYGVWPGEWNTHIFDLKPKRMIERLEKYFVEDEKIKQELKNSRPRGHRITF
jgi:hypothetical protein